MLDDIYALADVEICRRIGQKIKTTRLKQNISQMELADLSQVSLSSVKRIEEGDVKSFESMLRLLRTLGKLDVFIPLVEEEQLSPNEYFALMNKSLKPLRKRASKSHKPVKNEDIAQW